MSGSGKFLSGLIIGATAGVMTGMLIAPASGFQTRNRLMRSSRRYSRQAVDAVRQYLEGIRQGKVKGDVISAQETEEMLNRLKGTPNA